MAQEGHAERRAFRSDLLAHAAEVGAGPASRIRVLLVAEPRLMAEALAMILGADPDLQVVGIQTDPRLAHNDVRGMQPDVVVLDYLSTSPDLVELTADLRQEFSDLKVVILSPVCEDEVLLRFVEAGATGCVTTDRSPAELVNSIKRVHAGQLLFAQELLIRLLRRSPGRQPELRHTAQLLAPRQLEVLEAVATGLSTNEIAARLDISPHTVRTHVKNILVKLEVRSKLEAVMIALREGWVRFPP